MKTRTLIFYNYFRYITRIIFSIAYIIVGGQIQWKNCKIPNRPNHWLSIRPFGDLSTISTLSRIRRTIDRLLLFYSSRCCSCEAEDDAGIHGMLRWCSDDTADPGDDDTRHHSTEWRMTNRVPCRHGAPTCSLVPQESSYIHPHALSLCSGGWICFCTLAVITRTQQHTGDTDTTSFSDGKKNRLKAPH